MKPWQVNYKNYDLLTAAKLEEAVEEQRYPPCFCCQSKYTESPGDGEKVCVTVDLVLEGANIAMSFPCHTTAKLGLCYHAFCWGVCVYICDIGWNRV